MRRLPDAQRLVRDQEATVCATRIEDRWRHVQMELALVLQLPAAVFLNEDLSIAFILLESVAHERLDGRRARSLGDSREHVEKIDIELGPGERPVCRLDADRAVRRDTPLLQIR